MIMDRVAVQAPDLMARLTVGAVQVQVFNVIRVGRAVKAIRATKVVIIIKEISSSSSRVTRATQSSWIVGSIMPSPLASASTIRSIIKGQ